MNEKIITPFSNATQEVFKLMLDMSAIADTPETVNHLTVSQNEITVSIGLSGDISGETYFCFPQNTALEIVKIMSGMEISEVDDFVTSAMSEISNIISGNAATGLSEQEIVCNILPPKLEIGKTELKPENDQIENMINTTIHTKAGNVDLAIITQI